MSFLTASDRFRAALDPKLVEDVDQVGFYGTLAETRLPAISLFDMPVAIS